MPAYSKASHRWIAKPIYKRTFQTFRQGLIESVLKVREESNLQPWPRPLKQAVSLFGAGHVVYNEFIIV